MRLLPSRARVQHPAAQVILMLMFVAVTFVMTYLLMKMTKK